MKPKEILFHIGCRLVIAREFKRFIKPYRAAYEQMKQAHIHKNYFKNDLGVKGALSRARLLGLHKRPDLEILDIGTGPGMFPAVCNWYGHHVVGGDVPARHDECPWFRPCVEMFGVEVRPLTITTPDGLPEDYSGRWDLVTAFLTNFDSGWNGSGPWDSASWSTFIESVISRSLKPGGRLCILPVAQNAGALAEASKSFENAIHWPRWGVWVFSKTKD